MSNISINIQEIYNAGSKANKSSELVKTVRNNLNSTKNNIDGQILARNNISNQFSALNSALQSIENTINRIKSATEQNVAEYEKTDREIARKMKNINLPKIR